MEKLAKIWNRMEKKLARMVEILFLLMAIWLCINTNGCSGTFHGIGTDIKNGGAYVEKHVQP